MLLGTYVCSPAPCLEQKQVIEGSEDLHAGLVQDSNDSDAQVGDASQGLHQVQCSSSIEAAGRLIQEKRSRSRGQLDPDVDALSLPPADTPGILIPDRLSGHLLQTQHLDDGLDVPAYAFAGP